MNPDEKDISTGNTRGIKKSEYLFEECGFLIKIAEDFFTVSVNLFPPKNGSGLIVSKKVYEELRNVGIGIEINEELIKNSVANFNQNKKSISNIIVAKGKESVDGINGRFEITASSSNIQNPSNKDNVYNTLNSIITVQKDDPIAIIYPPIAGKGGVDVLGRVIPAVEGKKSDVRLGENTYTKEDNPNIVFAGVDGYIEHGDNTFSIKEVYTVFGDVDYHTGNIFGYGSLKVVGNVLNGFFINMKHNIEIAGYIGDAIIEAGGLIKAEGGFLGVGTGRIKAGGDLEVKFIQDQKIYCRGSLAFVREIVQAELFVRDKIIGKGNHASIIGGFAIAGSCVEIYSLGNEYGTNTVIEVGYDYEVKELLIKNRAELNRVKKELKKVDQEIVQFSRMKRLSEAMYARMKQLAELHTNYIEVVKTLNDENKAMVQNVRKPSDSYVKVQSIIYPGSKIIINRRTLLIKEKLINKTFALSEDNEIITK